MTLRDFITRMNLDPLVVLDQEIDLLNRTNNALVQTALTHDYSTTVLNVRITQNPPVT